MRRRCPHTLHIGTQAREVFDAQHKAIEELKALSALAEAEHDRASVSADRNLMGDVLRGRGRL